MNRLSYTHLLYVWQYSIFTNSYQFYVYGVNTTDIYHTIGEFIYRTLVDVKSIVYVDCNDNKLDYWKKKNIQIHNFHNKYL